jgi:hypothetical protein
MEVFFPFLTSGSDITRTASSCTLVCISLHVYDSTCSMDRPAESLIKDSLVSIVAKVTVCMYVLELGASLDKDVLTSLICCPAAQLASKQQAASDNTTCGHGRPKKESFHAMVNLLTLRLAGLASEVAQ